MKLRSLIAVVIIIAAAASCSQKKTSLSDQLNGQWNGTNYMEITMIDSTGNTVIQELNAPIKFEYLADSTFTAVVTITDEVSMNIGGIVSFVNSSATIKGSLNLQSVMDITGEIGINEDNTLFMKYSGENTTGGLFHKGSITATRLVE